MASKASQLRAACRLAGRHEAPPRITPRICGVCPEAHHMASAKACDAVYGAELPLTAKLLRELQYNMFYVTDHTTHFYRNNFV